MSSNVIRPANLNVKNFIANMDRFHQEYLRKLDQTDPELAQKIRARDERVSKEIYEPDPMGGG